MLGEPFVKVLTYFPQSPTRRPEEEKMQLLDPQALSAVR